MSPRNLDAQDLAFRQQLLRGALVTLTLDDKQAQTLRFQYNPETVTRARSGQWEHKENKKGATPAQEKARLDAQRGGGLYAKSETINIKIVFDVTEAILRGDADSNGKLPEDNGVLPELAILEGMAISKEQTGDDDKKSTDKLDSVAPMALLLILGPRSFPVVVTSVNIVEQRFTPMLVPTRAEVDLRFRVLESIENASNSTVAKAFAKLFADRKRLGQEIYPFSTSEAEAIAKALVPTDAGGKKP
jgi:hypothetical protein